MVVRSIILSALLVCVAPLAAFAQQSDTMPAASPIASPIATHHHRHHRHHKHVPQCRDASGKFIKCGFGATAAPRPNPSPS